MRIKLAALLICLMVLGGCSTPKSVYVLDQAEIISVKAGETVTAKFDGWLFSQRAVNRVMDAKIKDVNLR